MLVAPVLFQCIILRSHDFKIQNIFWVLHSYDVKFNIRLEGLAYSAYQGCGSRINGVSIFFFQGKAEKDREGEEQEARETDTQHCHPATLLPRFCLDDLHPLPFSTLG